MNRDPHLHLIEQCIDALDKEIEAVRKKPSQEVLKSGVFVRKIEDQYVYRFETSTNSIRFADRVQLLDENQQYTALLGEADKEFIELLTAENFGPEIREIQAEWENDFILRQMQHQLMRIDDPDDFPMLQRLLDRNFEDETELPRSDDPTGLNHAQQQALLKAMSQPVSFIWGPPGTGKTSTLGHIVARLLSEKHRVLFVSNTNRAVDVGLLATLQALKENAIPFSGDRITRFGELILDQPELEAVHFEAEVERLTKKNAIKDDSLADDILDLEEKIKLLEKTDPKSAEPLKVRLEFMKQNAEPSDTDTGVRELVLLRKKKAVFTTMAKVCTSELLQREDFDAVVIDEGSMVNIPYLLIMALRCDRHLVIAGDPMQLPPISVAEDSKSRAWLETDVFAWASRARSAEDLFRWHDENPKCTTFFDTQYRMQGQLAELVSKSFYQGRLKSRTAAKSGAAIYLYDSSKSELGMSQEPSDRAGFKPVNQVHQQQILELVQELVYQHNMPRWEIGIITPFRHSSWRYFQELRSRELSGIEAGTIHTFQGREKEIIILDTVVSVDKSGKGSRSYRVRPFDENKSGLNVARLLNVALSRSKGKLYVFADLDHINNLYQGSFFGNLMDNINGSAKMLN